MLRGSLPAPQLGAALLLLVLYPEALLSYPLRGTLGWVLTLLLPPPLSSPTLPLPVDQQRVITEP